MIVETDPITILAEREKAPSRLSPELQTLVRSAEFKAWFGDWEHDPGNASRVVDENGEPALVYFGGPPGIQRLRGDKRTRTGADEVGYYFTRRLSNARFYAETLRDRQTDDVAPSSVYSAFLNMRNPYERRPGDDLKTGRITAAPEGYDGYINDATAEVVVFSPDQFLFVREDSVNAASPQIPLSSVISMEKK